MNDVQIVFGLMMGHLFKEHEGKMRFYDDKDDKGMIYKMETIRGNEEIKDKDGNVTMIPYLEVKVVRLTQKEFMEDRPLIVLPGEKGV